jgi:hypothetical protein
MDVLDVAFREPGREMLKTCCRIEEDSMVEP